MRRTSGIQLAWPSLWKSPADGLVVLVPTAFTSYQSVSQQKPAFQVVSPGAHVALVEGQLRPAGVLMLR